MINEKKLIEDLEEQYKSLIPEDDTDFCKIWQIKQDIKIIEAQPQVGEWIQVSERLPDNSKEDWVLAQVQEDNGYMWIPRVMEYREQMDDWYDESFGWLKERHGDVFKVIAWMPLPEPYKEEVKE